MPLENTEFYVHLIFIQIDKYFHEYFYDFIPFFYHIPGIIYVNFYISFIIYLPLLVTTRVFFTFLQKKVSKMVL